MGKSQCNGLEGNEIQIAEAVQPKLNTWERQKLVVPEKINAECVLTCMIYHKVIGYSVPFSIWLHKDCVLRCADVIADGQVLLLLCNLTRYYSTLYSIIEH